MIDVIIINLGETNLKKLIIFILAFSFLLVTGCKKSDNPVDNSETDIPSDPANVTVPAVTINNIQPTATFSKSTTNNSRIQMNLTGLVNPITKQPISLSALQNIFVTEDNVVKGIKVTKVGTNNVLKADIVFTVDISGSMGQEADSIASSIIKFAQKLQATGLDVQFGCVGFYGNVEGAMNLTNAQNLEKYLNHSYGTYRAQGFSGTDSASLENKAATFTTGHSTVAEDGAVAILFAHNHFAWRSGAQRIFINFTDEPTQPDNQVAWGTENLCNTIGGIATVHTVWSGGKDTVNVSSWSKGYRERPWEMSEKTGGTVVLVESDASGLDLSNLPVTGALSNSYLVEFITSDQQGTHTVTIIVKETNADGKRTYTNITY